MTDQNETLQPQGSDASPQGDQNNNQSMESLLANENLNVEMPQAGQIRKGVIASLHVFLCKRGNPEGCLKYKKSWIASSPCGLLAMTV